MVLSGIEQYEKNPAFLLVTVARKTHRPFVSLPTVAPPQMYFLAFGNSTRCLQFVIWVLHHSMLLHAVICFIVYKAYITGQGHSTASLF